MMWPFQNLFQISWPQSKHSKALKYRIFIFTDLVHGYIDMAMYHIRQARAPDDTSVLGSMSVGIAKV